MLDTSADKLQKEFEEGFIVDTLTDLVNPMSAVGSVAGETEGIFGYQDWQRYTASKLAAISAAVAVIDDDRKSGKTFYEKVIDYVRLTVGVVSEDEECIAYKSADGVSFCQNAAIGKAALYGELKKNGFFERLKPAYATLEILTSMALEDGSSLLVESIDSLREHLEGQVRKYEQQVAGGGEGRKFQIKQWQLNKYKALLDNVDQSHAKASELLSGLDVQVVKQTIKNQEIMYLRPT